MYTAFLTAVCHTQLRNGTSSVLTAVRSKQPRYGTSSCSSQSDLNCYAQICMLPAGQLATLHWLIQQRGIPVGRGTVASAAAGGRIAVLSYLHSVAPTCGWDTWTCRAAAAAGQLEALTWLQMQHPPCPIDVQVTNLWKFRMVLPVLLIVMC
jgi:hypothetical protein